MDTRKKFSILELLIIIILAYSIMPIVSRIFSMYLTTYAYLAVVIFTLLAIVVLQGQNFIVQIISIIFPILMLQFLIYVVSSPSLILWAYGILTELLAVIVGFFILKIEDYKIVRVFTFLLFLFLLITAITTIIGLQNDPEAARYLATVAEADDEKNVKYNLMNIGGYEFVYTFALIYPAVIYGFKRKKINIIVLIAYIILDIVLIINTGYTIALLLFIMSTVFVFLRRDISVKAIIAIIIISILVMIVFFPLVARGLEALADVIDNETIATRLKDLAGGKEGLEASEDNRLERYMMSFNSFLSHPIFGGMFNPVSLGGHSFILDRIAQYGMFGVFALIFIYRAIYIKFYRPYKNKKGYGFVFWTFLQSIILSFVNTGMRISVLALFVPIIFTYVDKKGNKYENSLDSKRLTQHV